MSKKVIISGSTGMVGSIVLQLCLDSAEVSEIISFVRKPTSIHHTKYKEVVIADFLHYENQKYLSQILAQTLDESVTQTLNIGLQKLSTIVKTLYVENPSAPKLTVDAGDGALYAKLSVPESHKHHFHRLAEHHHLALTPGEIFYGTPYRDSLTPLRTTQDWYRLSLMADPTH